MVSVPDSESSVPSSNMNQEKVRDIRSALREGEIGLLSVNHEEFRDILAPISNFFHVYSFVTVTFQSISRKFPSYLGQCMVLGF